MKKVNNAKTIVTAIFPVKLAPPGKIGIRPIAVTSEIDVENNVQVNESIYSFWVAPFKKLNIAEVTQTDKIVSIINDAVFCFVDFRPARSAQVEIPMNETMISSVSNPYTGIRNSIQIKDRIMLLDALKYVAAMYVKNNTKHARGEMSDA